MGVLPLPSGPALAAESPPGKKEAAPGRKAACSGEHSKKTTPAVTLQASALAALVAVLRVIQSPFTSVVWHLEAAVSVLEVALEVANLNREDAR